LFFLANVMYPNCLGCSVPIASYPGLLTPAFVACSTHAGEGLVSRAMMYLDVWKNGTILLYNCKAAFWIQETSPRLCDVNHSVVLWFVFAISSALVYLLLSGNVHSCTCPGTSWVRG